MPSKHLPSTRALQCFLAAAEELNFRSAAQSLNMSQPPLSRQIQGLEDLLRASPAVRDVSKKLVERLRDAALDLAIVGDVATPPADLSLAWIASEPMMAMLPADHPAALRDVVTLDDLGATPLFWFARSDNSAFHDKCARVFSAHGYCAPRRLEPKDFTMLLAAVAAGEGVALCPQSMQAMSRTGVVYRALAAGLAPLLAIDIQVSWRTRETRPAVLEKVAAIRAHMAARR